MTCPGCGQPVQPVQSFCPNCGQPNPSPSIPPLPTSPPAPFPWEVIIGVVALLAGLALAGAVTVALPAENLALATILGSLTVGAVILLTVWFIGLRPQRLSPAWLGLASPQVSPHQAAILTVAALLLSLGFTALYGLAAEASKLELLVPPEVPTEILLPGPAAGLSFLALALWTPLVEEIFFRGFVFRALVPRFGLPAATIGSAALFSLFHVLPGVLLPIFVTGILLALLYHRTGSLWPCIAAHAGQNGLVVLYTLFWQ